MMWRVLVVTAFLAGFAAAQEAAPPPTGSPVSPAKRELVLQIIAIIEPAKLTGEIETALIADLERRYPQILAQVVPGLTRPEEESARSAHDRAVAESFQRVAKRFRTLYEERIQLAQILEEIYMPLYDKYYTDAELQDLLTFYRTPTGGKTLRVTTQLVQEAVDGSNARLMPQLLGIFQEVMEEEKAAWPKPEPPREQTPKDAPVEPPPPAAGAHL
ncbi:MAG TPA: DUF2059 domain-containing protein [Acidobacteriota bacterium]|nr:DUF2059 domain-containing protein [Acidobacteriota bacterium]HQF86329.1 DUF2059 domain-containing protein [Acidobacteriota bacterium]HQG90428.1 DUF2059 domain-containing protein [Acidobacteriota bacterium]HQK86229.1 DUF2059 domain-containing protein [Acidobacteriota bacterium]